MGHGPGPSHDPLGDEPNCSDQLPYTRDSRENSRVPRGRQGPDFLHPRLSAMAVHPLMLPVSLDSGHVSRFSPGRPGSRLSYAVQAAAHQYLIQTHLCLVRNLDI